MSSEKIHWWRTEFGELENDAVSSAIRNENVSQGEITRAFEADLAELIGVEHVIATSSGTAALMMALIAVDVGPGTEVIVPNRTWIATAHAAYLLGAAVVLVDVEKNRPVMNVETVEAKITKNTRAIIPVHMNGRGVDVPAIVELGKHTGVAVIEDAAQALGSKNHFGRLGAVSDVGCFSLSVAKIISSGQGGFSVTNLKEIADSMRNIRTHGVENTVDADSWNRPGLNFRLTDMQSAIGREQLKKLSNRIKHCKEIYRMYEEGLSGIGRLIPIPVDLDAGEVPIYNEVLCADRDSLVKFLAAKGIETRAFYPDLDYAPYLDQGHSDFPNSRLFGTQGLYLPSGPNQKIEDIRKVIEVINSGDKKNEW